MYKVQRAAAYTSMARELEKQEEMLDLYSPKLSSSNAARNMQAASLKSMIYRYHRQIASLINIEMDVGSYQVSFITISGAATKQLN